MVYDYHGDCLGEYPAVGAELRQRSELGEERYRHDRDTARQEAEETARQFAAATAAARARTMPLVHVTREEFRRPRESFYDRSVIVQRGMWYHQEQRTKVGRTGVMDESINIVRECHIMAEEDSWSGLNKVRDQVQKSIKEFGRSQGEELNGECWEFGSDFEESECYL